MANNEKLLEVKSLKQHFKVGYGKNKMVIKAVDDISFDIKKGEVFGLVGESGCGKTTTGRTIIKLYDATSGEILYNGKRIGGGIQQFTDNIQNAKNEAKEKISALKADADTLSASAKEVVIHKEESLSNKEEIAVIKEKITSNETEIKRINDELNQYIALEKEKIKAMKKDNALSKDLVKTMQDIQMIFQDPISSLNPRMTVKDIVAEGLKIAGGYTKQEIEEKVFEILKLVGLVPEHAHRYPHEFSGGQRQRIGIARALIVNPKLLIADEPISALDVSIQAQVINLLKDLQSKLDLTILFIAHDLSVVKYFSDRIGVMYFGKLVELASADKLFKNPTHPYTKSLLSAIPLPDPDYERNRVRVVYDPSIHKYSQDNQPYLGEIEKDHYVYGSKEELEKYKAEVTKNNKK